MTLTEPSESTAPAATLADRRPAHAVMTHLLHQLDDRARVLGVAPTEVPRDLASWQIGAEGEVIVGQELAMLPDHWRVLHAVPAGSGGADIDHLVIGPGGVFVLNTKHHRRKSVRVGTHLVWLDGFSQKSYQSELLRRCAQVRDVLTRPGGPKVSARPLLVFVAAESFAVSGPQQVDALPASALVRFLLAQPPLLDAEQVEVLLEAARQPSTWGAPDRVLLEPDPTGRFHALPPAAPVGRSRTSGTRPARTTRIALRPPRSRAAARRRPSLGRPLASLAVGVAMLAALPIAATVTASVIAAVLQVLTSR